MRETTFRRDERQRAGTTPVHLRGDDGAWAPAPNLEP